MKVFKSESRTGFIILGIFVLMALNFVLLNKDSVYSRRQNVSMSKWKKDFKTNNIKSISIYAHKENIPAKYEKEKRYWSPISGIYVNGILTEPENLFNWQDFIYYHCGKYYILFSVKEIDSVVYNFSENFYKEYSSNGKVLYSSSIFNSKRLYQKKYKGYLPDCDE